MTDKTLEQYRNRVDEVGQSLLEVISSIALGDMDVEIEIPEDLDELADLAVGLRYMIDDLKEAKAQESLQPVKDEIQSIVELEPPTEPLAPPRRDEQAISSGGEFEGSVVIGDMNGDEWLPGMSKAVEKSETIRFQNGNEEHSLALPIQVNNEVIGVVGFNRESEQGWTENEIATIEAIIEQVGLALENRRLIEQTQQALSETDLLYKASADINTTQQYDEILTVLRRTTLLGVNSKHLSFNLFNHAWTDERMPDTLIPISQWADSMGTFSDDELIPLNTWTTAKDLLQKESPTIILDIPNDPRMDSNLRKLFADKMNATMVVFAPLVAAGQWIGIAIATYDETQGFHSAEIQRLSTLSAQAASSIQNIRLVEETSRRANQLETAAQIAREASGTLDVDVLLNRAVNLVRDRFGYYHASIFLVDGGQATVAASTGDIGKQLVESGHSLSLMEGGSIIGHVCYVGEPLVVNEVSKSDTHRPHPLLPNTEAELGIPLKIGSRVIGALDVQSIKANIFNDDDISVLQTLADQIAIAVENARSYELSQKSVEEMREVDRLKSQFLANMSHELRTPLNSIIGFSRVILKGIDGPINEMQQQDLDAIYNSGQHLLDMINSILDLSKIEAGKMELSIEDLELDELVKSVISTAMGLVKEKPIKIVNELPDNLPLVFADRTRIRQVLLNLLQNATKFTDEGTITVNAEERRNEDGSSELILSVTDTGIGISLEDQDKLFEPFSQVDDSPTRKTGGSGLGLSISRRLIEMQGGSIWLKSSEGRGSTFYFSIPIVQDSTPEPVIVEEIIEGKKIVISIDDDAKVINLYNRYLEPQGFQVMAITDPTKAIEQIKQIKPMAITLDIMMPERDGWEIIKELKNDPDTKDIPVIICSILDNKEKAFDLGATNYLVKPILENELVDAIKRLDLKLSGRPPEILMIDDDRNAMRLVNKVLSNEDEYQLRFAEGGLNGLAEIKSNPPDAVILDLFMPDLDGFSLLQSIRTDPAFKDLPVIVLTGGDLSKEQISELSTHKQAILRKDALDGDELLDCLHKILST